MTAISRSVALAAATSTALMATAAFAYPALAAERAPKPAASIELTDGTLEWGVKESFRKYVTGIAMGEITVDEGAEQADENGVFTFSGGTGTYDTGTHAVDTSFEGGVNFVSKIHGFDIKLADIELVTEDRESGKITADVTLNGDTTEDVDLADLDLAEVAPGRGDGGEMTFDDIPVTLTADGAEAFNGMYEEGAELDSASLTVKSAATGGGTGGTGGTGGSGGTGGDGGTGGSGGSAGGTGGSTSGGGSTASGGPTGGGSDAPAEAGTVVDGNLDWGVKQSFRKYVVGPIGKGKVELKDGAKENGDGYRFPGGNGEYNVETPALDAAFDGGVDFLAHAEGDGYALELKFSAFRIDAKAGGSSLIADVSSKDRESGKVTEHKGLALAKLTVAADSLTPEGDVITLQDVPATLTKQGAQAFGGFYEEGEALDPVTAAVSLSDDADLPDGDGSTGGSSGGSTGGVDPASVGGSSGTAGTVGGSEALASTGASAPTVPLLGGAAVLATIGAAAVYATRRRSMES
ncbi:HtaA domain-containing protein [Streptomyces sp. P38-E01]|uniref:HtaA domain-containing protein n=1 Tax=Streptomyces tardus TaxID=2780544 RepID=A0A949JH46_9ACTN|nr:HtaA domain-containing protein [Streptomyces tardus]MBU7599352.1 HtaA domain-containing protein [Streptomyces tardus]